jgi:lipid-A-disaccharide synthase-like uncharacterized protein
VNDVLPELLPLIFWVLSILGTGFYVYLIIKVVEDA